MTTIRSRRAITLIAVLSTFACVSPRSFQAKTPAVELAGLTATCEDALLAVHQIITPGGHGSWFPESDLIEFVLTLRSEGATSFTVDRIDVTRHDGVRVAALSGMEAGQHLQQVLQVEHVKEQVVGQASTGIVGSTTVPGLPVPMSVFKPDLNNKHAVERARLAAEVARRSLAVPVAIGPGQVVERRSVFLPSSITPRALHVVFQTGRGPMELDLAVDGPTGESAPPASPVEVGTATSGAKG